MGKGYFVPDHEARGGASAWNCAAPLPQVPRREVQFALPLRPGGEEKSFTVCWAQRLCVSAVKKSSGGGEDKGYFGNRGWQVRFLPWRESGGSVVEQRSAKAGTHVAYSPSGKIRGQGLGIRGKGLGKRRDTGHGKRVVLGNFGGFKFGRRMSGDMIQSQERSSPVSRNPYPVQGSGRW